MVTTHRCIRMQMDGDARKWESLVVQNLKVTPWKLMVLESESRALQQQRQLVRVVPKQAAIVPLRQRPLTPGCSACSKLKER